MAVSGIASAFTVNPSDPNDPRQQFLQLANAINSGNLTGAQQSFAQLSQSLGLNSSGTPANPFMQALATIGQDLQSGDLQGAQQTLASLQQQARSGRGHHHHHGGGQDGGTATGANASGNSTPSLLADGIGTNLDVTA
jgi:hypothetical protein